MTAELCEGMVDFADTPDERAEWVRLHQAWLVLDELDAPSREFGAPGARSLAAGARRDGLERLQRVLVKHTSLLLCQHMARPGASR